MAAKKKTKRPAVKKKAAVKRRPAAKKAARKRKAKPAKKSVKRIVRQTPPPRPAKKLPPRSKTVDAVDETSRESFPASDPPSWTPVTGEDR